MTEHIHLPQSLSHADYKAVQQVTQQDYAFIITYPRNRGRRALMAMVLEDLNRTPYYFPLRDQNTNLYKFLEDIVWDQGFPEDFGQQTKQALQERGITPQDLAEAFAHDLDQLQKDPFALILDEVDRLLEDEENFIAFIEYLAPRMPSQAQIIVDGRQLRRQPWHHLVIENVAAVVGAEDTIDRGIFDIDTPELGQIEFFSLSGNPRIVSDGRSIKSWDGTLPRNLCYFFIEKQMVTRQEIFDTFWPHLGVKEATNVFHVTKRKISEKVGYDITAYSNGFYVPSPNVKVMYDAREFENLVEEALTNPDTVNPAVWMRAVQLYRQPYLNGLDMPWANEKRARLKEGYVQALIGLARFHRGLQEYERALGYFRRAVAEKPNREDVHRDIMQLLGQKGDIDGVKQQFTLLKKVLKSDHGLKPAQETQRIYDLIIGE